MTIGFVENLKPMMTRFPPKQEVHVVTFAIYSTRKTRLSWWALPLSRRLRRLILIA